MNTNGRPILRVLLIEDSQEDAELVSRELKKDGYKVVSQRVDTEAALQLAIDEKIWDVVICDYSMPNLSAVKALELVRSSMQDLPFIFLVAFLLFCGGGLLFLLHISGGIPID